MKGLGPPRQGWTTMTTTGDYWPQSVIQGADDVILTIDYVVSAIQKRKDTPTERGQYLSYYLSKVSTDGMCTPQMLAAGLKAWRSYHNIQNRPTAAAGLPRMTLKEHVDWTTN